MDPVWVQPSRTLHYDHAMITVGEEGARKNIEFLTDRQTHRQVGVIIVQSMKLVCLETSEKYHRYVISIHGFYRIKSLSGTILLPVIKF